MTLAEQASRAAGGEDPLVLDVLAAAYAEEGRTAQSVDTARRALALADRAGDRELVAGLHERLALYEQGRPYRRAAAVPQGAR